MKMRVVTIAIPVDTGRKLNVHKTFKKTSRTSSGRIMSVQLTSCVYGSNNERVEETQNDSEKEMTYSSTYFAKP